ncbi:MAG TPA: hypothetical protein VJJ23_01605 [Candidatus Nanoarchaeia archaeon]|nr:hypothetical protein [Candidatus Nanoarchaeia archaeon]
MKDIEKYIKICPKCRSLNIKVENALTTGFLPNSYICINCKYKGMIFPEIEISRLEKGKDEDRKQ